MTTNTIIEFRVEKATLIDRIVGYFKMRRFKCVTLIDRIVGYFKMRRFMRIRKPARRA